MNLKRIQELLTDILKSDVSTEGLDYVFPEVKSIVFYSLAGSSEEQEPLIEYHRINKSYFTINDYTKDDLIPKDDTKDDDLVSNSEMLLTVKQSMNDKEDPHELVIKRVGDGYVLHLFERELDSDKIINMIKNNKFNYIRFFSQPDSPATYTYRLSLSNMSDEDEDSTGYYFNKVKSFTVKGANGSTVEDPEFPQTLEIKDLIKLLTNNNYNYEIDKNSGNDNLQINMY